MAGKRTILETLLDVLLFVAKMILYALIMAATVLTVDAIVLFVLNQLNVDTWLSLLWLEGLVMAVVGGAAGMTHRGAPYPLSRARIGRKIYWINFVVRKPLFWASFGLAGFVLIICGYLIWMVQ